MDGKCILLVRVSTESQSYDAQEKELFEMAIADGYKEENIIPICYKESGIRLKEEERNGLNDMKRYIESDSSINCVYAWECSRIARKKKILFSVLEYLVERKIQLIIKEPYIKMLHKDGKINEGSEMMFTFFAQISESEMRNKNDRFIRGKKENKSKGRFNGGRIKYGYTVDSNGKVRIDDTQANEIRYIVNTYLTTNHSQLSLYTELQERGYKITYSGMRRLLNDKEYYIDCGNAWYKPLMDEEMWHAVQAKNANNNTQTDKGKRNYFLGAKLIKCQNCGHTMLAHLGTGSYMCRHTTKQHNCECNNNIAVNINAIDSIAWHFAIQRHFVFAEQDKNTQLATYTTQKNIAEEKLATALANNKTYEDKMARAVEAYTFGKVNKIRFDALVAKIEKENEDNANAITQHKSDIERINKLIESLNSVGELFQNYARKHRKGKSSTELTDIKEMYEITHTHIEQIEVENVEVELQRGLTKCTKVTVKLFGDLGIWVTDLSSNKEEFISQGNTFELYYNPMAKRRVDEKFFTIENGEIKYQPVEWLERINRNKQKKEREARKQK
ncbi:MAG: recombinase family protein [Muribaculaceae bacterium]|nr:recombinase family protein [Muribaculaceae bacterium]